ncbi:MAG: oligosaccharide flippase family protein [Rubrivivax sp.]|nr:oligosaccharide flippase family protein [Rubrivivax sp.]
MKQGAHRLARVFQSELLGSLVWKALNTIGLQGSVLLSTVVVARLVGLESFGAYAVMATTVMSAAGLAQAGTSLTATKFVGEHLHSDPGQVAGVLRMCGQLTLAMAGLMAAGLALGSGPLATHLLGQPQLAPHLAWAGVAVACQTLAVYMNGALEGFGAFRHVSRVGVLSGLAHLLLTGLGAWLYGLDGAVVGFVLSMACRLALYANALGAVRREHRIPAAGQVGKAQWRALLRFTLPAGLASLVTLPCHWLVTALVAREPGGLQLAGLFMAATQIRLVVVQLPIMLNSVSFSVLSRLRGQRRVHEYRQVFWANMAASALLCLVVAGAAALLAAPIMSSYGSQFAAGQAVLLILLASVVPEVLALSAYQLVQSSGRMWRSLLLIIGPRDLLYLALAAAWLPAYGVHGAAAAYLAAQAFSLASTLVVGRGGMVPHGTSRPD